MIAVSSKRVEGWLGFRWLPWSITGAAVLPQCAFVLFGQLLGYPTWLGAAGHFALVALWMNFTYLCAVVAAVATAWAIRAHLAKGREVEGSVSASRPDDSRGLCVTSMATSSIVVVCASYYAWAVVVSRHTLVGPFRFAEVAFAARGISEAGSTYWVLFGHAVPAAIVGVLVLVGAPMRYKALNTSVRQVNH